MRPLLPLALTVAVLPSCITSDLNLAALPNVPPSIESAPGAPEHPLNRVIQYEPSITDGGVGPFLPLNLEVVVRDPDVEQSLEFQIHVDGRTGGGDDGGRVTDEDSSDDPSLRTMTYRTNDFTDVLSRPGCHKIEMLVSERFLPGRPEPEVEGDLGTAVWWIATRATDGETVEMWDCPR